MAAPVDGLDWTQNVIHVSLVPGDIIEYNVLTIYLGLTCICNTMWFSMYTWFRYVNKICNFTKMITYTWRSKNVVLEEKTRECLWDSGERRKLESVCGTLENVVERSRQWILLVPEWLWIINVLTTIRSLGHYFTGSSRSVTNYRI